MVRFYDPSRTDPSVYLIQNIQSLFSHQNTIQENEIKGSLKSFLNEKRYMDVIQQYLDKEKEFPAIIINKSSPKNNGLSSSNEDFSYFSSYYNRRANEIIFCSNFMKDILEIKENLDRELTIAYMAQIKKIDLDDDESFACTQIKACRNQYENYYNINEDLKKEMTFNCAKYLMKVK
jgi:hypothetical protein